MNLFIAVNYVVYEFITWMTMCTWSSIHEYNGAPIGSAGEDDDACLRARLVYINRIYNVNILHAIYSIGISYEQIAWI